MLVPLANTKPVFWIYNETFKAILPTYFNYRNSSEKNQLSNLMNVVFNGRDSDLDVEDPLPFFMKNHFQMPYLLLDTLRRANPWLKLDFCIGKVIELNGD